MNCPTCAASVPEDAVFCPKCGTRLGGRPVTDPPDSMPLAAGTVARQEPATLAAEAGRRRESSLAPEHELWQGGYSPKAMYGPWIGAALATIAGLVAVAFLRNDTTGWIIFAVAAILLWAALLLMLLYRKVSVKYRLTNQRLFHEVGVLRRVTDRIEVIDIDDVTVEQGLVERILGVGTIHVSSSDRTTPELLMPGIDNVKQVADTIDHARRAERQRRGLFIESV
jgi:membrane protein YdbS with pleckstrin-like domain